MLTGHRGFWDQGRGREGLNGAVVKGANDIEECRGVQIFLSGVGRGRGA